MFKNPRMTQQIDTQGECPSLDPSFSGGDSATPSPSSSFCLHDSPLDSSVVWSQDLSTRAPLYSPGFVSSSSSKHDSITPHVDIPLPQADYAFMNMLDAMAFFGDGSDLFDCHQIMIDHGLPAVSVELDGTDYRLPPYAFASQPNIPLGLNMGGVPESLITPECTPCFSEQIFNAAEAPSACPPRLETRGYYMDGLPQTVIPSQTVAQPMTPCPSRGPGIHSPLKAEEGSTPTKLLMECEASMAPTPDGSPVTTLNPRTSALRLQKKLVDAGRAPSGQPRSPRPLRMPKQCSAVVKRTFDAAIVPKAIFPCTHPDCNKTPPGKSIFQRREHLKRHIHCVHSGNRPFYCKLCDMNFSRSDNYKAHQDTNAHKNKMNGNDYIEEEYVELKKREQPKRLKQPRRKVKGN